MRSSLCFPSPQKGYPEQKHAFGYGLQRDFEARCLVQMLDASSDTRLRALG